MGNFAYQTKTGETKQFDALNEDDAMRKLATFTDADPHSGVQDTAFVTPTVLSTPTGSASPSPTPAAGLPLNAPKVPEPTGGAYDVNGTVFSKAMNEIRTKLTDNNDLTDQKRKLLQQLYDRPLTDEEKKSLSPSQVTAIMSGNRNMIETEVRLVNDSIAGRNDTLDSAINFSTDLYTKEQDRLDTQKKDAENTILSFINTYGSNAPAALRSIYGDERVQQLKDLGFDIDQLAANGLPPTLQETKDSSGNSTGFTVTIPQDIAGSTNQLAYRNNNPGNLRFANQDGATLGAGGFAKFDSPEAGYQALLNQIKLDQGRGLTVADFVSKYAPPGENDTQTYIKQFTDSLGVPATTNIKDLSTQDMANFIMKKESGSTVQQTESDTESQADAIQAGLLPPPNPAAGRSSVATQKLFAELSRRGFDTGQAYLQYLAAQKVVASLNGSQQVRFRALAGSVVNTIDEVNTLASQIKNSGVVPLNKAKLEAYVKLNGNSQYGQLASQYLAAVNTLKEEFTSLATGGYAPTDASWALANSQINADYGVDQLSASLTEIQRLINYRVNALEGVQPVVPGSPAGDGSTNDPLGILQ